MSHWRGRFEDAPELEAVVEWLDRWYHVPVVLLLAGFMLWTRVRSWENFVVDGQVFFSGNDAWYHFRTVTYTVQNWPHTMPFEPWTYFSYGTSSGQFGTLFDQIVATVALIVGLGSPDQQTIAMVLLFAPALFGVAAVVPAYFIGRRLGGRPGGITAVTVLALSAGSLLSRSVVGFSDHHVAEALFQAIGVLGVMVAVSVAERDRPVYEQFRDREVGALRRTIGWSALGGFAIALYIWTWPPGVLLLGILGVFFLLRLVVEHLRRGSPEHTAIAGVLSLSTAGVLLLASLQTTAITATMPSLLQPLLAFAVAAGCGFMAWLSRHWEREDLSAAFYPVAVFGLLAVGAGAMAVLVPDLFDYFVNNVLRVVGFTTSPTAGTVGEAQPLRRPGTLYNRHGLAVVIAVLGILMVLAEQAIADDPSAEQLLVVVWAVFVTAATFTQARFGYYLVIPFAALTGLVVGRVVSWADISPRSESIEVYQVLTLLSVVVVVVAPLVLVAPTAMAAGANNGPGPGVLGWNENLEWMQENTPMEGSFGGAQNKMAYYGTFPMTDDYDYDDGAYGVMSWWDYGHWITVLGERIPNANPFQQGATTAANFLLAPNESQANAVLDDVDEDDAETRYVAIDWKMVNPYGGRGFGGKFFAPPRFYDAGDVSQGDYYRAIRFRAGQGSSFFYSFQQPYYDTSVVRLYHFHGSAVDPEPIVLDWSYQTDNRGRQIVAVPPKESNASTLGRFESLEAAREYVGVDGTSQVGGFGPYPSERVPAMEHYRLVGTSERTAYSSGSHNAGFLLTAQSLGFPLQRASGGTCADGQVPIQTRGITYCMVEQARDFLRPNTPYWTKTFERVPGATIEGTGPANATVQARVTMRIPAGNETFEYRQRTVTDEDGNFNMTVPYSTTGYDDWGPENGHTNVSVRATGPYEFTAASGNGTHLLRWSAQADVDEAKVNGNDDSPVVVEMDSEVVASRDEIDSEDANVNVTDEQDANGTGGTETNESTESDTSDENASASLDAVGARQVRSTG